VIVVDAGVALKWFKQESGSETARAVLLPEPLIAPELVMAEGLDAAGQEAAQVDCWRS
jgi:predicted nucleic acid-binding protein